LKKIIIIVQIFLGCVLTVYSQHSKYWIFFKDKKDVSFDPYAYFDTKAIERRLLHGVSLYDSTDFPLNTSYLQTITEHVDSISQTTRWFNAVAVYASENQLAYITKLPFVKEITLIKSTSYLSWDKVMDEAYSLNVFFTQKEVLSGQVERMGGHHFREHGYTGKGVRIAVFDAGFPSVNTHEAFSHIRNDNRILKTWDFVKKRENVYGHSSHGTMVLSCIAGKYGDTLLGLATDAEFLLARTEMSIREPFSEEENWLAAAEWADKNGAHIINSSLGYTKERYFYEDMDGKTSLVSRAANMAASKGILVVNAAGNEGSGKWKYIGAPADADSVLTVGGMYSGKKPLTSISYMELRKNYKIDFSSFGPSYDKRMKPNVCAYGQAFVASKNAYQTISGTSFASPLVAGFAACAYQKHKDFTNMDLFKAIEQSGDLYPYFDYAHGFGVPQASFFTDTIKESYKPTFDFKKADEFLSIIVFSNENEKTLPPCHVSHYKDLLFYHIQNPDKTLDKYYVVEVNNIEPVRISLNLLRKGQIINVYYLGYTDTYTIN